MDLGLSGKILFAMSQSHSGNLQLPEEDYQSVIEILQIKYFTNYHESPRSIVEYLLVC